MTSIVRTVGHGTATAIQFGDLVHGAGVRAVTDVRRFAGSRHNPQFAHDEMARWLPDAGIEYRWVPALGGRRKASPDSPNVGLRNLQFRGYADHMATSEFASSVSDLAEVAASVSVAVMCSESVWWRCHRRLLADHLVLVEGMQVEHLFHDGRLAEHSVTSGARLDGRHVRYDALPR
jgi:uncharacterized protein (DUF488 family)